MSAPNDLQRLAPILRGFLADPTQPVQNISEFVRVSPIDYSDPITELVPEIYLESSLTTANASARR